MDYDDYQLLDDNTLNLMKDEFNSNKKLDRESITRQIFDSLVTCYNSCFGLDNKLNPALRNCIYQNRTTIKKLIDNLVSLFNYELPKERKFSTFNIFKFLNLICSISQQYLHWQNLDEKEYYKKTANQSIEDLLNIILETTKCLENSNFLLFKHM